jgi:hypothetical protein
LPQDGEGIGDAVVNFLLPLVDDLYPRVMDGDDEEGIPSHESVSAFAPPGIQALQDVRKGRTPEPLVPGKGALSVEGNRLVDRDEISPFCHDPEFLKGRLHRSSPCKKAVGFFGPTAS